jgi:hypothetical protein
MLRCDPILISLVTVAYAVSGFADDVNASGKWVSLFNGKDLTGWVKQNDGTFTVTNGVIHLEGGKGWLRSERQFTNFVFEAEWRGLETNYNSGFFIRAPGEGKPWATNVWQVNTKQNAIGELLEGSKKVVLSKLPPRPAGEWVKFHLEVRGHEIALDVDGQRAWEFKEFTPDSGYLGLQAEGRPFEFRNLRVQELPGVLMWDKLSPQIIFAPKPK